MKSSIAPHPGELADVRSVSEWFGWLASRGGVPHPDDRAFQTCDEIRRLGFAHEGDHPEGHVMIVGPLFDGASPALARSYDRAMGEALETLAKAEIDQYALAMASDAVAETKAQLLAATRPKDLSERVPGPFTVRRLVGWLPSSTGSLFGVYQRRREYAVLVWAGDVESPRKVEAIEWDDDARALVIRTD